MPQRIWLGLLLALALAGRPPGIPTSLPVGFQWDEPTLVNLAVWVFSEGSLDPRFFHYPGGMVYLLAALFGVALLFGTLLGAWPGLKAGLTSLAAGTYPRPPGGGIVYKFPTRGVSLLYILGRLVSAILGTLTVWWSYRLGRALAGERTAWVAGLLVALSALHAANSALVTTDIACAAFLAWFLADLLGGATPRRTGIALGLAAAFKYSGGIGLYLWPLGLLFPPEGHDRRSWNRLWLRLLPWTAGLFVALNPFILLTPRAFFRDFTYEASHMRGGTAHFGEGIAIGEGGFGVIASTLWRDLGILPLLGLVAAILWAASRGSRSAPAAEGGAGPRPRGVLLLGAWCGLYLVQLATWKTVYARYLLPVWPALCVLAAVGWTALVAQVETRWRVRGPRRGVGLSAAVPLLLALVVLPGLLPLGRSMAGRMRPDPRVEMSAELQRILVDGGAVAVEYGGPWIPPTEAEVFGTDLLGRHAPDGWRRLGMRYLVATGRETYLPAGSPDSLHANRAAIGREARVVWQRGPYIIFDLGERAGDLGAVRRLLREGEAPRALEQVAAILRDDPSNGAASILQGDASLAVRDTAGAVDAYLRAADLLPADPTPFLSLGAIALSAGRWEMAIEAFSRAQERAPRDPVTANNLATALLYRAEESVTRGKRDDAARDLAAALQLARRAISVDPGEERYRRLEAQTRELARRWNLSLSDVP